MATIKAVVEHASGIPLGGLGTGSVEIRPDGFFHEWQIFNLGRWAPRQPECCRADGPNLPPDALAFYVRTQQGKAPPLVRRLGVRSDVNSMYSFTWLKNVRRIEFDGRYPAATLRYLDEDLPVTVAARMFSPFIPHDSRTSGTPGFYAVFTVKNTSNEPVDVSLLGTLKNPLAWGAKDRQLRNSITRAGGTTRLTMRTAATAACKATLGSLSFSVAGGCPSWVAGDYADHLAEYHAWDDTYGIASESLQHDFRAAGCLPSLAGDRSPSGLVRMTDA